MNKDWQAIIIMVAIIGAGFIGHVMTKVSYKTPITKEQIVYCTHICEPNNDLFRMYVGGECWCGNGARVTPPEENKSK